MNAGLRIRNGLPLYLVGKLINDFDPIFCRAHNDSISFFGARDRLSIILKVVNNRKDSTGVKWNYTYAFSSNEVKRNIKLFTMKDTCGDRSAVPDGTRTFLSRDFPALRAGLF